MGRTSYQQAVPSTPQGYLSRTNLVLVSEFLEIVILNLKTKFQILNFCLQTYTQNQLSMSSVSDQGQFTSTLTTLFTIFLMYERFTSATLEDMQHCHTLPRNKTLFHHKLHNQCFCNLYFLKLCQHPSSSFLEFDLCQPTSLGPCHPSPLHE